MVAELTAGGEEFRVQAGPVHVDDEGAKFVDGEKVRRVIEGAAQGLAAGAADIIDHAPAVAVLAVNAAAVLPAAAAVDFVGLAEGGGNSVMTIQKKGTLMNVTVA